MSPLMMINNGIIDSQCKWNVRSSRPNGKPKQHMHGVMQAASTLRCHSMELHMLVKYENELPHARPINKQIHE